MFEKVLNALLLSKPKDKPHGNFKANYISVLITEKPSKQPLQRNQILIPAELALLYHPVSSFINSKLARICKPSEFSQIYFNNFIKLATVLCFNAVLLKEWLNISIIQSLLCAM